MKKISIYLYVILLFGCVESRNNSQLKTVNLPVKKAQGEQILKNLLLGNPLEITYTHEALIIWDESEAYYCKVICLDDEKMFSFGKKGKGPNEIIMLSNSIFDFSKSVYSLYSNNTGKILTFSVSDLKNEIIEPAYQNENLRYEHGYLSSILFTKNDTFLAKVCNLEKNNSYALLNKNFKEIISGGEYPIGKGNNNYPKLSIGMMYQGKSVYNIDENIGYSFIANCVGYEVFTLRNNRIDILEQSYKTHPKIIHNGPGHFRYEEDNIKGYLGVSYTDKYVYALFSGMSKQSVNDDIYKLYHGNVIHVFDWDGKNVGVIELNKYINTLSFKNDSVFYGTNIKDEPCIYEFKVKYNYDK